MRQFLTKGQTALGHIIHYYSRCQVSKYTASCAIKNNLSLLRSKNVICSRLPRSKTSYALGYCVVRRYVTWVATWGDIVEEFFFIFFYVILSSHI